MTLKINPMLHRLQAFLQTDIRYLLRGGFWLGANQVATSAISFFLAVAFANLFPKEAYGNYRYVLSVAGVLTAFSLTGLNTAIIQSTARGYDGLFSRSFRLNLRWSVLMVAASFAVALYYFMQGNLPLGWSLLLAGIILPVFNSSQLYKSYLNGKKEFRTLTFLNFIFTALSALALFLTLLYTDNFVLVIAVYYLIYTSVSLILHFLVVRSYRPNAQLDEKSITYSKHLSAINILDVIATYLDKVLAFQFLGATALATYSFAVAAPEQLRSLVGVLQTLAIPKLAARNTGEIKGTIFRKIAKVMIFTLPLALLYFFLSPWLFQLVFPQYLEAIPYSQVFIFIILVEGGLAGAVFKSQMAIKQSYLINISSNVMKIVLLVALSLPFGLWGIIAARILSRYFSFFYSLYLLKKM